MSKAGDNTQDLARAAGDGGSFGALYCRVAPALYAWAELRIGPALRARIDPDDLVQEICCRAFQGFHNYQPERGPFRGWIFGIGNTVLKNALMQLGRVPTQARPAALDQSTDLLDQLPDEVTSVSRRLAKSERMKEFLEHVRGLDEEEQKLLLYRGLEGWTHVQIAERMNLSVDTVEKRWQRLRTRLRDQDLPADLLN